MDPATTNDHQVSSSHIPDDFAFSTDYKDEWIYLPNKSDPFWETDVHELDLNDNFWKEGEFIVDSTIDPFWEIYSLKSNSWRKLNGIDMPIPSPGWSHVNLNEFFHWLNRKDGMVSFDFSKEMFFATALPSDSTIIYTPAKSILVVLNGSVSLIYNYNMDYFHIWILGELGVKESWRKIFVFGPSSYVLWFIGAWKSRIFFTEIYRYWTLKLFDFSTMIEEIWNTGDSVCDQIVIYKENLLPFGGMKN
jgi:F-box interacting protein